MTPEEAEEKSEIIRKTLSVLGEHFDNVKLLVNIRNDDGTYSSWLNMGVGDPYSHYGMARHFVEQEQAAMRDTGSDEEEVED